MEQPKPRPPARIVPKYKLPNQFTMKDGCKIRSHSAMVDDNGMVRYLNAITVNSWSKDCSEGKDIYPESDVVEAKYL